MRASLGKLRNTILRRVANNACIVSVGVHDSLQEALLNKYLNPLVVIRKSVCLI
jgi:hypothetical protein